MRSWGIFLIVSILSGIVGLLTILSAVWILVEIGVARRNIKALRDENSRADDDFNSSDKVMGPDQDGPLGAFKSLVSRAKVEDAEVESRQSRRSLSSPIKVKDQVLPFRP